MNQNTLANLIISLLVRLVSVGEVWLMAWIFDPNIDSGMVWLLGLIYGGICVAINSAVERVKR